MLSCPRVRRDWCLFLGRALENTSDYTQASGAVWHKLSCCCVAVAGVFIPLLGSNVEPICLLGKVNVQKNERFSRFGWCRRFMVLVTKKVGSPE